MSLKADNSHALSGRYDDIPMKKVEEADSVGKSCKIDTIRELEMYLDDIYESEFVKKQIRLNNDEPLLATVAEKVVEDHDLQTKCSALNEQLVWYEKNHKSQQQKVLFLEDTLRKINDERTELKTNVKEMEIQRKRDDQEISILRSENRTLKTLLGNKETELKESAEESRHHQQSKSFAKSTDVTQKIFDIDEKCMELEENVQMVQKENVQLKEELVVMQKYLSDVKSESKAKRSCLQDLEEKHSKLLDKQDTLIEINREMKEEIAGYKELCADFDDLMKKNRRRIVEIEEYKVEVAKLKENEREYLQHLTTMVKKGKNLGNEVIRLEQEKLELQNEMDQMQLRDSEIYPSRIKEQEKYFRGMLKDIMLALEVDLNIDTLDAEHLFNEIKNVIVLKKMHIKEQDISLDEMKNTVKKLNNHLMFANSKNKELRKCKTQIDAKINELQLQLDFINKQTDVKSEAVLGEQQPCRHIEKKEKSCMEEVEMKLKCVTDEKEISGSVATRSSIYKQSVAIASSDRESSKKVFLTRSPIIESNIRVQRWPCIKNKSLIQEVNLSRKMTREQKKAVRGKDSDEEEDLMFNNDDIDNLLNSLL